MMGPIARTSIARTSPETLRFLRCAVAGHSAIPIATLCCHRIHPVSKRVFSSTRSIKPSTQFQQSRSISQSSRSRAELPVNPQTHYDFFPSTLPDGPPPSGRFSINLRKLRSEFLRLQATAHPDLHPQERKGQAEALSSRINEAYKTLQSPLLRAQYLLSLRGDHSTTDDAEKLGDDSEDQELLLEVLELREQIEEAQSADEIQEMKQENEVRIAESVKTLEDAFESDHLADAAKEAVRLRYWINVADTLHAWEEGKPAPNLQH